MYVVLHECTFLNMFKIILKCSCNFDKQSLCHSTLQILTIYAIINKVSKFTMSLCAHSYEFIHNIFY